LFFWLSASAWACPSYRLGPAGASATTFKIGTGLYLIVIAMLSSLIGGYLAGRLRSRWIGGVHSDEVYFRDTAHGFVAWAFASVLGAALLASPASTLLGGGAAAVTHGAASAVSQSSGPMDGNIDTLLRSDKPAAQGPLVVSSPRARTGSLIFLIFPSSHESGTKPITRIDLCMRRLSR
jgi:hypothetical protein